MENTSEAANNTLLELIHSVTKGLFEKCDSDELDDLDEILSCDDSIEIDLDDSDADTDKEIALNELTKRLEVTKEQASLFAVIFAKHLENHECCPKDLADKLSIGIPRFDVLHTNLNTLYEKGLIVKAIKWGNKDSYLISAEIQKKVFANNISDNNNLKTDEFGLAENSVVYFKMAQEGHIDSDMLAFYLKHLLEINPTLPLSKLIKKLNLPDDEVVALFGLYCSVIDGERSFNLNYFMSAVYPKYSMRMKIKHKFLHGNARLLKSRIIVFEEQNFKTGEVINFTDSGLHLAFGKAKKLLEIQADDFVLPKMMPSIEIHERKLFFNQQEDEAFNRLTHILGDKEFRSLQKQLSTEGMMSGVSVLLYGAPGTGKTESVYQAARMTGRDIFKVDISSIRDKYIGESEKKTKRIFEDYRICMKKRGPMPILFLNEADAIIGSRMSVRDSVDQMNNTMQNILLEEMERFNGIMFCTTNLEGNIDNAFDRRFLYKIKFNLPDTNVRAAILHNRIDTLNQEQAFELSSRYFLSGGQIDNIHRKLVSERLLGSGEPGFNFIEKLCAEESSLKRNERNVIKGFLRQRE